MKRQDMQYDIIIPVFRPDERFPVLLSRLLKQTVPPEKIILINTDEEAWEQSGMQEKLSSDGIFPFCELHHVEKKDFDHGNTRNEGVRFSSAPYFVFMTQDAVPVNKCLVENLLWPLGKDIQMSYGRQIPYEDADPAERFSRHFNYPPRDDTKRLEDLNRLGIKTYFASNVCAAYERECFDALGGFLERTVFNEDMIYAATLLRAGGQIAYASDALVRHSHRYTAKQQFQRNFDLAVSQADHPEIFANVKSEGEGIRMVCLTAKFLCKNGHFSALPKLFFLSSAKYAGYLLGKHYKKLPMFLIERFSMNKSYWEKKDA